MLPSRSRTQDLCGWGRFPVETCRVYRPEKNSEVVSLVRSGGEPSLISRGLGRSYGDAGLNSAGVTIHHAHLNRFLSFDEQTGTLECEAGVSLAEVIEVFLRRGFLPPVLPGTKFVTVGGAVAADIHGKNHHREGSFGDFLEGFDLLTAGGDVLTCTRQENAEVFFATVGGMGLTGTILRARLRMRKVESARLSVEVQKARRLEEALELMAASDDQYLYSVAWVDCLAGEKTLGRSLLLRGNHLPEAELTHRGANLFATPRRPSFSVPFSLPSFFLNAPTVKAFNALYYAMHSRAQRSMVDFDRFFFPLDRLANWNRLYGRRGFVQFQAALPKANAWPGFSAMLRRVAGSGLASFQGVLKSLGKGSGGLLSFPMEGFTLALDLPATRGIQKVYSELSQLALDHGGRVYLAKDALLTPEMFALMYPSLDEFLSIKGKIDPRGLFSSSLARRLKIGA